MAMENRFELEQEADGDVSLVESEDFYLEDQHLTYEDIDETRITHEHVQNRSLNISKL